MGDNIC